MAEDLDQLHLAAIQFGDEEAFGRWMSAVEHRLRRGLWSFAAQIDIEAVLQETFLQIWQVAPKFTPDGRPNALLRFAARCARNLAISETRRIRANPEEIDELERSLIQAEEVVDPVEPDPTLRRILSDCAALLPPKPRSAIAARMAGGGADPDRVLADRLGMKLNTFLQNVSRARKLLMTCLQESGVDLADQFA